MLSLKIDTAEPREIIDLTDKVKGVIPESSNGLLNIFVPHTTAAISIADLDPGTDKDILDALKNIMPKLDFRHPHDPSHAPDHIWSAIIGPSTQVPVKNGKMQLGTWQSIILLEFDGPRKRDVFISFLEE
jgi:secondary thiamine-phosphate synthase enzyme